MPTYIVIQNVLEYICTCAELWADEAVLFCWNADAGRTGWLCL